ncbi:MAG: F0F1 ATP synthase subunit delta [Dongiaceae bacterium]
MAAGGIGSGGLATRYAAALFDLADEKKALDAVADDLKSIRTMIGSSEDLRRVLRSPVIGRTEQGRAMAAILDAAGTGDLVRRFVGLVAEKRRLFALPRMIDAYLAELARRRGETTAEVVSATPLDEESQKRLVEALRRVAGQRVSIDLKVDPDLIAGLVVKVGSRMVDSSLRTKLNRMQIAMKGNG